MAIAKLASLNRANVLTVMYDALREAFGRRSLGYVQAKRMSLDMGQIALEREHALRIAVRDLGAGFQAIADFHTYFRSCPHGERVFFSNCPGCLASSYKKTSSPTMCHLQLTEPPIAGAQCNAEYFQQNGTI